MKNLIKKLGLGKIALAGILLFYGFLNMNYSSDENKYNDGIRHGGLHGLGAYPIKKNHLSLDDLDNVLIDNGIPIKDYIPSH